MLELDLQFFGGRGAKSSGSSGSASGTNSASGGGSGAATDTSVAIDDTTQAQPMGQSYSAFMAMSDDDKADYIDNMSSQPVPVFLADNNFQKFIYNSDMNDKPQLVNDATLDKMNGQELFRTIDSVYNSRNDIGYRADEIAAQVLKGSVTRVSDSGGSVYGRGIYFADSYSSSAVYGSRSGNVQRTAVIRGKLNSNAKVINYNTARNGLNTEINSGSKLGKSLGKISRTDRESAVSLFALSKGYDVISSGHGYMNVLNRNALTMSDQIKAKSNKW